MDVLVTGAAGGLGRRLVEHLLAEGHGVTASDLTLRPDMPVQLDITDLTDRIAVSRLLSPGFDAVIHAGNHPNFFSARPAERLLAENMAMNANVFWSALAVGVKRIIFISSIQAMLEADVTRWRAWDRPRAGEDSPAGIPCLPLTGSAPGILGNNSYGMSKVFGEQTLQGLARHDPELRAASLRLAHVMRPSQRERYTRKGGHRQGFRREAGTYVDADDAARACRLAIEHVKPGAQTYLMARSPQITGMSDEQIREAYFDDVPLRGPIGGPGGLVDLIQEKADLGWEPTDDRLEMPPPAG
ncbi:MAG: NAD(P)-dependent oxidoreductase [Planctomycetota bacterium]